ncbi:hypothetical protein Hanom_Chr12g01171491 [Helianthus anomalus]
MWVQCVFVPYAYLFVHYWFIHFEVLLLPDGLMALFWFIFPMFFVCMWFFVGFVVPDVAFSSVCLSGGLNQFFFALLVADPGVPRNSAGLEKNGKKLVVTLNDFKNIGENISKGTPWKQCCGRNVINSRVNFRFAHCGLVVLTVWPQSFKNIYFPPIVYYNFPILLPASNSIRNVC